MPKLLTIDDEEVITLPPVRKPIFSPEDSEDLHRAKQHQSRNDSVNRKNAKERLQALK